MYIGLCGGIASTASVPSPSSPRSRSRPSISKRLLLPFSAASPTHGPGECPRTRCLPPCRGGAKRPLLHAYTPPHALFVNIPYFISILSRLSPRRVPPAPVALRSYIYRIHPSFGLSRSCSLLPVVFCSTMDIIGMSTSVALSASECGCESRRQPTRMSQVGIWKLVSTERPL